MKNIHLLLFVLIFLPLSVLAQDLSISESVVYLNQHLDDLSFYDEEWEYIEYNEKDHSLWIGIYVYLDVDYGEDLEITMYLDGNFWHEKYTSDGDGRYVTIRFENNDILEMDYYGEYESNEFSFANSSDRTTEVFLDLLDLIHAESK